MRVFSLNEYFTNNLRVMKILGLWPEKSYLSSPIYMFQGIMVQVIFNLCTNVLMMMYVIMAEKNLQALVGAGYFLLGFMGSAKALFIFYHYHTFKHLLNSEVHRVVDVQLTKKQQMILHQNLSTWKTLHLSYTYLSIVICAVLAISPLLSKEPYAFALKAWYPFDYKNPTIYGFVYVHQTISNWVSTCVNLHSTSFTVGFLSYIAAECEVLADIAENLEGISEDADDRLRTCVEYHKQLITYAKSIQSYFSKYLLIQFGPTCTAAALMMTNLTVIFDLQGDFLPVLSLQIGVWADMYLYCWYGNEVTIKSNNIPYAAFKSKWLNASQQYKKRLLFFTHRSQKPIKIFAANLFELSISTFLGIFRIAYSYYTLLRQLSKDE